MTRHLVNKMQILFCLNGFEGIDEGSDDGCDDEETASSKMARRLFSTYLGFDEGSDCGWRYSMETANNILVGRKNNKK